MAVCCSTVSNLKVSSSNGGHEVVGCAHAAFAASCRRPAHEAQNGGPEVQLDSTPPYTVQRPTFESCNQRHAEVLNGICTGAARDLHPDQVVKPVSQMA